MQPPPSPWYRKDTDVGFWVTVPGDGIDLYARIWREPAGTTPVATLTFIHGLGEHCSRYDHVFKRFASEFRIRVLSWDQRGFGRTAFPNAFKDTGAFAPGAGIVLGDNQGWNVAMADIHRACAPSADYEFRVEGVPHFLMGHSMGGLLALMFAIEHGQKVDLAGLILSAPALRPGFPVPWLKRTMGSLLSRVLGSFNIPTELDSTGISRDAAVVEQYLSDPLVHDKGSLRLLAGLLDNGEQILTSRFTAYDAKLPLLMSFGTADHLTSFSAGKEFFDKVQASDKTFREWADAYHERMQIHNEPEKEQVIKEYGEWIVKHSSK